MTQKNLQTDWIEEFEKIDAHYESFYQEDVNYASFYSIYIDRANNIQTIKEEKVFFKQKNIITREELVGILKKNCFHNKNRYTVLSILKYNFNLQPSDVEHFIKSPTSHIHLSDIKFEKTISMFQDLNNIITLFYEKNNDISEKVNSIQTKKIIISQSRKKTLRKMV
jgi:hypothetical protein